MSWRLADPEHDSRELIKNDGDRGRPWQTPAFCFYSYHGDFFKVSKTGNIGYLNMSTHLQDN